MLSPSWTDFLTTLAQAAVALLALLFVSFQIARDRWVGDPARRLIAIQTLLEFLTPSFFAIVALLPVQPFNLWNLNMMVWQIGGLITGIWGLFASLMIIRYGARHPAKNGSFFKGQLKLQPLAIVEYLAILYFTVTNNLLLAAAMMIWLLLSGSYETWLFFAELEPNAS